MTGSGGGGENPAEAISKGMKLGKGSTFPGSFFLKMDFSPSNPESSLNV